MQLTVPSFAKTNWILKILGKRADGFHEIRTVLQSIDLHDTLAISRTETAEVRVDIEGRQLDPGQDNLVVKAARCLQQASGTGLGARVVLNKRIPIGAGLGGGSSNAAVALMALNQLWNCGMRAEGLANLAAQLGSDVPFFLRGGTVAAGGRGERLTPLPDARTAREILLLFPDLGVSTKAAYEMGRWSPYQPPSRLTTPESDTTIQRFCQAAEAGERLETVLENDFEDPLYKSYPILAHARDGLVAAGCSRVIMSGSGSTLVGFAPPEEIGSIGETAAATVDGEVFRSFTLSRDDYWKRLIGAGLARLES